MTPMRITIELASPVVVTGPIHFDAILSYAKLRVTRHERTSVPHGLAWEPTGDWPTLPLFKRHFDKYSWWAASAVVPSGPRSNIKWVKQFDAEHIDGLALGRATKVTVTNGIWRNHMVTLEVVHCERLEFFAIGYPQKVKQLLRRIRGIGKKMSQGYGRIRDVRIERLSGDADSFCEDWRCDSGPSRNIPDAFAVARQLEGGMTIHAPIAPPYWRCSEQSIVLARTPAQ